MHRRLTLFLILVPTLSLIHGQTSTSSLGLYCTAGLVPDGYIDFSGMPPSPKMNPQSGQYAPSANVTATLPVIGVPGLTATVSIPPLHYSSLATYPAYSVDGGTLQLNGLPISGSSGFPTVLTLTFSQPIAGVGLNAETTGRFDYTYTLQVGSAVPSSGSAFATTASGLTYSLYVPQTQSLQIVGLHQTVFQMASVQFQGGEYYAVALSNFRVRSTAAPDAASAVPTFGLQQWLRADTADDSDPLGGGTWMDQSGKGRNATPSTNPPVLTADGHNCQAAFQFTGDQFFSFNLPIASWTEMTIFLVAKAGTDAGPYSPAILWAADALWSETFVSPYQTHVYARFGTTETANNLYYTRPGGSIGQDFTTTRAVHDSGTDNLYVNGLAVQNREGKLHALAAGGGAATIGQGVDNTFFHGEISEILVYNRVLSADEAALVENYLAQKYGTH